MANQPKKYQKFVATAATATLVASAIVPVASAAEKNFTDIEKYAQETQDAIYSLVDRGVITGKSDSIFAPAESITRGQVVKMLGRYLVNEGVAEVPADWASKARFTDLPVDYKDQDLVKNAAVVFDNGVFKGSNGKLNVSNNITRENMALVLDRAITALNGKSLVELAKEDGLKGNVKDIDTAKAEARDAILALNAYGISDVDNFKPKNNVTRAQFALFLERTIEAVLSDTTAELVEKAVVAGNALPKPEDVTKDNAADAQTKVDLAQKALDKAQKALKEDKELTADEKAELQEKLDKVADQIKDVQKAIDEATETGTAGISSVEAPNDSKLVVKFGKAIDEDLATEIEKSGKRFIVFDGGATANSKLDTDKVIQSKTISFNEKRTEAEVILDRDIAADTKYTVALIDADANEVAGVVYSFGPKVLKEGAQSPNIVVNEEQDKIELDFKEKMAAEALNEDNYTVYENGNKVGDLKDFVETGKWVDSTSKQKVEFKLKKDANPGLLAGKTYKIQVDADEVKTDDGKTLSSNKRTITFSTPSISKAQPNAVIARVQGNDIIVTFDKDLSNNLHFNKNQITVKKAGGQTVTVNSVEKGTGSKEIVLKADDLDIDLTYTIDLPANGVENAYFANASNNAKNGLKAQAQKDIEVTNVTAQLQQQVDNKGKADLVLKFDQRVDVESFNNLSGDQIKIKDGGDTYTISGNLNAEVYYGDNTGKSIVIKDVKEKFILQGESQEDDKFTPEQGVTYTIEFAAKSIKTDAGEDAKTNQEKLKTTFGGVSVSKPEFSKIRVNSAEEIVIEFEEDIDTTNLKASDIKVLGFELYANGKFEAATLQGDSQIKFSTSGNKLTLKPANKDVKFVTSADDNEEFVSILADTIKGKVSKVENEALNSTQLEAKNLIDRANPIIIGATKTDSDSIVVTYSENVSFKGSDSAKQAAQFTVEKASKNAYGKEALASNDSNEIKITFNEEDTFKSDLDLAKVVVKYSKNTNVLVKDENGNEAATQSIVGLKAN